jgi:hypothetical protein
LWQKEIADKFPLGGTLVKSFSPYSECAEGVKRASDELKRPASTKYTFPPMIMIKIKDIRGAIMTEPSYEELKARLADLEKQVETKKRSGAMEFRVSEKGGVSVYGLGRFPVTLYYEQWTRLLDAAPDLKAFIEENKSKLKLKQG